jgi:CDP-diacylglycerol--serine O-phosphatidyltransferase
MCATSLEDPKQKWTVYLIPNLLTTSNLFSGLIAILAVYHERHLIAAIAVMVALIFDMLDGKLARWTNGTSQFGAEYDSLCDLVAFGVAPGILVYSWALGSYNILGPLAMFVFVAGGALRLARFNVMAATGSDSKYFTGLPIPAAANLLSTLVIFDLEVAHFGATEKAVMAIILMFLLGIMMVSTITYRNFKNFKMTRLPSFGNAALILLLLIVILVIAWPQITPFVLFACYAMSGPIENLASLLSKKV